MPHTRYASAAGRIEWLRHGAAAAVTAQAELAAVAGISYRVKPVDLLIAGIAATHNLGVLHYDHDIVERHTALSFASVWVAPRGRVG
jgi:predicted nucleic acid-binding protein